MTKIGYLIPEFPGQTHAFFWREIRALEAMGVTVRIFSTRPPPPGVRSHTWTADAEARTTYLMPPRALDIGPTIRAVSRLTRLFGGDGLPVEWRALMEAAICLPFSASLRQACELDGIGYLHVHSCARSALLAAICRKLGGPSYGLTLHGDISIYGPYQPFKWRGAHIAITVTRVLRETILRKMPFLDPSRIRVCGMGVETDKFCRKAPYRPWSSGMPLRLFSCGRLNRGKGHDTAITAVSLLVGRGINAHLEIAGEDDLGGSGYRRDLEKFIERNGLGDRVRLLGSVSEDTVLAKLRSAHLFVLASRMEALGVAYMEAMAVELPTIGSRTGGVPELIDDNINGVLVEPGDPEKLADAIENVVRDPAGAEALGRAARKTVVARFRSSLSAEIIREAAAEAVAAREAV